MTILYNGLTPY